MPNYCCKTCNFNTKIKPHYVRHINTNRHISLNTNQSVEQNTDKEPNTNYYLLLHNRKWSKFNREFEERSAFPRHKYEMRYVFVDIRDCLTYNY
jgi:hypothetical protein